MTWRGWVFLVLIMVAFLLMMVGGNLAAGVWV